MVRFFASVAPRLILLSFLTVLTCAAPALADLVTWTLDIHYDGVDGTAVSGSFTYDTSMSLVVASNVTYYHNPHAYWSGHMMYGANGWPSAPYTFPNPPSIHLKPGVYDSLYFSMDYGSGGEIGMGGYSCFCPTAPYRT